MQKSEEKKDINYWPYAIVGMILTVVVLGAWTIKIAVNNPVQESRTYMMNYQDVEENINELIARQKAFEKKFTIDMSQNRLHLGKNVLRIRIVDNETHRPVPNAEILAIVTRPTTSRQDIRLETFTYKKDGFYVSEPFELTREGRWNVQVRVTIGDNVGFTTYKSFVKKD
ncbi:FixH family protein [Hydrogenimonas sp.]